MKVNKGRELLPCTCTFQTKTVTAEDRRGQEKGRGRGQTQNTSPAVQYPSQPITFGPPEHKAKALVVPFLQDSHLVINDIIADGGKQEGVR
jgi:hypothetical protein